MEILTEKMADLDSNSCKVKCSLDVATLSNGPKQNKNLWRSLGVNDSIKTSLRKIIEQS